YHGYAIPLVTERCRRKIDLAAIAEARDRLTGLRIQREQMLLTHREDARVVAPAPVRDALADHQRRQPFGPVDQRLLRPHRATGLRIDGLREPEAVRHIQQAVDVDR